MELPGTLVWSHPRLIGIGAIIAGMAVAASEDRAVRQAAGWRGKSRRDRTVRDLARAACCIAVALLSLGCGRAGESDESRDASTSADSIDPQDSLSDVRPDDGPGPRVRADGCAEGPAPYAVPCSLEILGKICKYYQACKGSPPGDESVSVYLCTTVFEKGYQWVHQKVEPCPPDGGLPDGG